MDERTNRDDGNSSIFVYVRLAISEYTPNSPDKYVGSTGFQGVRCRADCESALGALRIQPDSQSGGFSEANTL